jgi:transposase
MGFLVSSEWFGMLKTKTVSSADFSIFLMLMKEILVKVNVDTKRRVVVHADNAKIHVSKLMRKVARNIDLKFSFLPPYCPEIAPVELMFDIIKSKMSPKRREKVVNFSKKEGMETIVQATEEMPK